MDNLNANKSDILKRLISERFATKKFNGKQIDDAIINKLYEMILLAPSSLNLQPWKIIVVKNNALKKKLKEASFNQEQISSCSHLLIFCTNTDTDELLKKIEQQMRIKKIPEDKIKSYMTMAYGYIKTYKDEKQKLAWLQRQVYLAVENALLGAKALGFDSCPMEGFIPEKYSEILNLPPNIVPTVLVPVGYAADMPREKIRMRKEDVIQEIV